MQKQHQNNIEVYKVIGAPGTGKTTRVVGNPELEMKGIMLENMEKYPLEDQMLVTYTKAGTEEAADRLAKMSDIPKYKIEDRVRTIHSASFNILGMDYEQTVSHWDKKQFCDSIGLDYGWSDSDDDIMGGDKMPGNALMDLYGWLKSNRKNLDQWKDCPQEWNQAYDPVKYMKQWESYKKKNNLKDFSDMIEDVVEMCATQLENLGWGVLFPDEDTTTMEMFIEARKDQNLKKDVIRGKGGFLDTNILYVDEVQDLTPLQWEWYLAQKLVCDKVYIGGDDDQTIYGWAGANPSFMLDEEGDFEVLETTYRIPRNVWNVCDDVIQQVEKRQSKTVQPDGEKGEAIYHNRPSPRQIAEYIKGTDGDVFILFRARYMIDEFTDHLHDQGIPYTNMSTFETWADDIVILRDALYKLHKTDQKLKGNEVSTMRDYCEERYINRNDSDSVSDVIATIGGYSQDEVEEMFSLPGISQKSITPSRFLEYTEDINYYQKNAILGSINKETVDIPKDKVRIGTIHSSKGKEADTVILATDSTPTILENMREDTMGQPGKHISDAERRVYYVGMSRASERLILLEGALDPSNSINVSDLVDDMSLLDDKSRATRGQQTSTW